MVYRKVPEFEIESDAIKTVEYMAVNNIKSLDEFIGTSTASDRLWGKIAEYIKGSYDRNFAWALKNRYLRNTADFRKKIIELKNNKSQSNYNFKSTLRHLIFILGDISSFN